MTALLGAMLLTASACGTATDIAARTEASTCSADSAGSGEGACAGGPAPVPDGDAPDRYDGVPVPAPVRDAGPADAGRDAATADAGSPAPWSQPPDPFGGDPCPSTLPSMGQCSVEGVLCPYSSDIACGCFGGTWWCARFVRQGPGGSGGIAGTGGTPGTGGAGAGGEPDGDAGLEQIACPPFLPTHGSPCIRGITLDCDYGDRSCRCSEGVWRC